MYGVAFAMVAAMFIAQPDPDQVLNKAMEMTREGRHEESERLLKDLKLNMVKNQQFYHFIRLTNNFATNKKAEAEFHAKQIDDAFENNLPRRYKALIYMMTEDLKNWKNDDLGDIERDMRHSANRLGNAQGGKDTQEVQDEIVKKLNKLIKDKEDAAAAAAAAQAKKDKENGVGKAKPPSQGQGQPAPESIVMGGAGSGKVDEKQLKQIAENWGTMPPAKRAMIVQEITRDLPPKFEPMIKNYFEALNRMHPNK
jgi:hypothetical protein